MYTAVRNIILFIIIMAPGTGCVEKFDPPAGNYQQLLVVEAFITNEKRAQTVRLGRSHPLDTSQIIPESNAVVNIRDQEQFLHEFTEIEPGVYSSDETRFLPVTGKIYVLQISTFDGRRYESESVVMRPVPEIGDLHFEEAYRPLKSSGELERGYQIYVDTHDPENNTHYYLWRWKHTWEIQSFFRSYHVYNPDNQSVSDRLEDINNCWNEVESNEILINATSGLAVDRVDDFPVRFVPFNTFLLRKKYSISVKQYSLTEEGFFYWENLKKTNETTGSIFDLQPFSVVGNIRNTDDPDEPVLGYFDASAVTSKRIFITNDDLPEDVVIPSGYEACIPLPEICTTKDSISHYVNQGYLLVQRLLRDRLIGPPDTMYFMAREECVDCRLRGTNKPPEFWD